MPCCIGCLSLPDAACVQAWNLTAHEVGRWMGREWLCFYAECIRYISEWVMCVYYIYICIYSQRHILMQCARMQTALGFVKGARSWYLRGRSESECQECSVHGLNRLHAWIEPCCRFVPCRLRVEGSREYGFRLIHKTHPISHGCEGAS